ncbi:hypothetical protein HS125_00645 [bacterium]|nr:hypothetical protein [bacterium]
MMDEKRPRATDEELLLLASGELPEARRAVLLSALEADPELARRLAVFRCLLEKPRHLPTERPSRRVLRALRHAARKEAAPVAGWDAWRRFFAWPRLTGAVAVAALFPALLVYTQRTAREPGGASPVADVAALEIRGRPRLGGRPPDLLGCQSERRGIGVPLDRRRLRARRAPGDASRDARRPLPRVGVAGVIHR